MPRVLCTCPASHGSSATSRARSLCFSQRAPPARAAPPPRYAARSHRGRNRSRPTRPRAFRAASRARDSRPTALSHARRGPPGPVRLRRRALRARSCRRGGAARAAARRRAGRRSSERMPSAIAPPLTFTRSGSSPSSRITARLWDANASFSSTRSSSRPRPRRARAASAPPAPARSPSRAGRPRRRPCRRTRRAARRRAPVPSPPLAITRAAAPSLMPLEFPAVTVPPSRNAGRSAASFSAPCRAADARRGDVADRDELVGEPPSASAAAQRAATRGRTRPAPRARRRSARRRSRRSRPSTRAGTAPPAAGSESASQASCPRRSGRRARSAPGFASTSGAATSTRLHRRRTGRRRRRDRVARADDRREPGRAEAVDGHAGDGLGQPGEQRGHPRDVSVVLAGLVGRSEPDVLDLPRGHAGARDRLADHEGGEVVRALARRARRRSARRAFAPPRG